MRASRAALVASIALAAVAWLGAACSAGNAAPPDATTGSGGHSSTGGGGQGGTAGCSALLCGQDVVSVTLAPQDPVLVIDNGVLPVPAQFVATGHQSGGGTITLDSGTWAFDRPDIATLSGTGALSPTGLAGGKGNVTFTLGAIKATTTATVKLRLSDDPQSIDPAIVGQFAGATVADPSLALLYPYDKTVFPRGLTGPTLQWNGGADSDVYYLHITSSAGTFEYEWWGTVPTPSRYDFLTTPVDVWKKLTDAAGGSDVTVSLQRYDGAKAYLPVTRTWTIAPANLAGTIYYWEVNDGNVVRIKPGDPAAENFLLKPAGVDCVACHSVSKNGSRLVAGFHGGWSPWGTFDAASGTSLFSSDIASGFEAISPTGSHVLWGQWLDGDHGSSGHLSLSTFDSVTELAELDPGGGAPSHPAWSGDGDKIVFSVRTDGNGLDFTQSTLWTTDVDLTTSTFSNTHQIVANDASRTTVTFGTFGPDSKWIAFERSTQARSRGAKSDIWLASADGSTLIALDQANGTGLLHGPEASSSYEPTFMPVAAGGYFWLVIVSERTYGNTLVTTDLDARNKQLWVTAIDANPLPGQDPSHPAFWLPGQGLDNNNMRGEWALSPCKMLGDTCTAGYECCNGFCHDDGNGNLTCENPMGCAQIGDSCKAAADCCDPAALCVGGFCAFNVPH